MLSNMFDPTNETERNWDFDIRDDVLDECNKFGDVLHIHVDKVSPQVGVVLLHQYCIIVMKYLSLSVGKCVCQVHHLSYRGCSIQFSEWKVLCWEEDCRSVHP